MTDSKIANTLQDLVHILKNPTVIVVALGYFVDIFDLTLFNMVRRASLIDLGVPETELVSKGLFLLNTQMIGMLIGGVIWGVLADRKGRLSTLFGSIILYSVANILNGMVTSFDAYILTRFVAGIGLAGELGVGITLIAEILPTEKRGLGTTIVAAIGVLGAVLGGIFVEIFNWRTCYFIGGGLGLALLFLRFQLHESGLFKKMAGQISQKGQLSLLFLNRKSLKKIFASLLIGMPIWFVAGILMPFSTEFAKSAGLNEIVISSRCVAIAYLGLAFGDLGSGILSQWLRSRRRAIQAFQLTGLFLILVIAIFLDQFNALTYYLFAFFLGSAVGYWALFVTISAENFGTNIRSTAATILPNLVRASVFPMSLLLGLLKNQFEYHTSVLIVGTLVLVLSFFGTRFINETFSQDLDYHEG